MNQLDRIEQEIARLQRNKRTLACDEAPAEDRPPPTHMSGSPCRLDARSMLKHMANGLGERAANLNALLDALPAKLPPQADEALWSLVANARNHP